MKFSVRYASDPFECRKSEETITVNTMDELKAFSEKKGYRIVVEFDNMVIWVADDYLDTI